jgi:hypothetical protein
MHVILWAAAHHIVAAVAAAHSEQSACLVVSGSNVTAVSAPGRRRWPIMTGLGLGGSGQAGPSESQVDGLIEAERHALGVGPLQLLIA